MSRTRPIRRSVLGVLAALVLAGCIGPGGNKAGGPGKPVVLRMATIDGEPGNKPQLDYLVDRVEEVSAGNVRIEVIYGVGNLAQDAEQQVVSGVADGAYDLGVVGTRVFDTLGINSFQALTAPMLIESYPLEQAVIDSDIPARMMRSLDGVHVTGLGVLAGGLRKPVAVDRPLLGPKDWRGITFAFFPSSEVSQVLHALGARRSEWGSGFSDGGENSLLVYRRNNDWNRAPYVTANVNLWPQTLGVIGHPHRLAGLTSEQRGWLAEAVRDAAARSTGLVDGDAGFVSGLCASGARFANASDADIEGLRSAFVPVYASVEKEAQTREFIAQIERLKEQTPPGDRLLIPAGCAGAAPGSTPSPGSSGQETKTTEVTPLDGGWEVTYSREELVTAHPDPSEVTPPNYGHFTLELHRGDFSFSQSDTVAGWTLTGTYVVDGDEIVFSQGLETWRYTWSVYRETLTLKKLGGHAPNCSLSVSLGQCEPTGLVVKPWRQVSA